MRCSGSGHGEAEPYSLLCRVGLCVRVPERGARSACRTSRSWADRAAALRRSCPRCHGVRRLPLLPKRLGGADCRPESGRAWRRALLPSPLWGAARLAPLWFGPLPGSRALFLPSQTVALAGRGLSGPGDTSQQGQAHCFECWRRRRRPPACRAALTASPRPPARSLAHSSGCPSPRGARPARRSGSAADARPQACGCGVGRAPARQADVCPGIAVGPGPAGPVPSSSFLSGSAHLLLRLPSAGARVGPVHELRA